MCVSKPRLLLTCEDKVINKGKVDLMNILSVTHLCNLSRTILAPFFFLRLFMENSSQLKPLERPPFDQ